MDLGKVNNQEKLKLCRWYFKVLDMSSFLAVAPSFTGCYCLPFVWLVNAAWFFKHAFLEPEYEEQKSLKKLVIWSGLGALVWAVAIAAWVITFQTCRVSWGEFGDAISVVIPTGSA